jgi:hypothetical protein
VLSVFRPTKRGEARGGGRGEAERGEAERGEDGMFAIEPNPRLGTTAFPPKPANTRSNSVVQSSEAILSLVVTSYFGSTRNI